MYLNVKTEDLPRGQSHRLYLTPKYRFSFMVKQYLFPQSEGYTSKTPFSVWNKYKCCMPLLYTGRLYTLGRRIRRLLAEKTGWVERSLQWRIPVFMWPLNTFLDNFGLSFRHFPGNFAHHPVFCCCYFAFNTSASDWTQNVVARHTFSLWKNTR